LREYFFDKWNDGIQNMDRNIALTRSTKF
jgi:hypothetical protein